MTQTGNYVAIAGVLVSILAHFNVIVGQDSVIAIIAGVAALYGVIHQYYVSHQAIKGVQQAQEAMKIE